MDPPKKEPLNRKDIDIQVMGEPSKVIATRTKDIMVFDSQIVVGNLEDFPIKLGDKVKSSYPGYVGKVGNVVAIYNIDGSVDQLPDYKFGTAGGELLESPRLEVLFPNGDVIRADIKYFSVFI